MSESVDMLDLLSAPHTPDRVVGWRGPQPIHCREFVARVCAWESLLTGVRGSKFALYINDSIEFASALFGAWHAGKTVYLPADTLPATCEALHGQVDGYLGEFERQWSPLAPAERAAASAPGRFRRLDPDFAGLVVHTSGSTGTAQAIPKFLRQMAAEVATLEDLFGAELGTADILATVSHQHIYGLLFKVLWPLAAGRAIHAQSCAYPEEIAQVLTSHDCVLISSPAHLKRLPDISAWSCTARRLHAVFSSGGPLSLDSALETERLLGRTPIEVYGSSETGGIAWRQRHAQSDDGWTPMARVEWRISEHDGMLEVCSAHLPDAHWFRMSDRAAPAEDNLRFRLQGRADRIVKIEEKRISLDAIERRLLSSPLASEVRVLVLEGRRDRIAAFVVPSSAGNALLDSEGKLAFNQRMRDWLSHSVERVALPRIWRYPDALPVNAQGKTTQAELLAMLDESQRPTMPRERLLEKTDERAVFELTAPRNLFYFDGHFPGAPILPGVVQIDWAIAYGRKCFDLPPAFSGIHALKFQQVIPPELPVTLELTHDRVKSCLTFKLSSRAGQHGSGRIQFGAPDA